MSSPRNRARRAAPRDPRRLSRPDSRRPRSAASASSPLLVVLLGCRRPPGEVSPGGRAEPNVTSGGTSPASGRRSRSTRKHAGPTSAAASRREEQPKLPGSSTVPARSRARLFLDLTDFLTTAPRARPRSLCSTVCSGQRGKEPPLGCGVHREDRHTRAVSEGLSRIGTRCARRRVRGELVGERTVGSFGHSSRRLDHRANAGGLGRSACRPATRADLDTASR